MSRMDQLRKMLDAEPDDAFLLYAMGQELHSAGDAESAEAHFAKCIEADPDHSYAYFHRAVMLDALGRRDDAIDVAREGEKAAQRVGDNKARAELHGMIESWS